MRNIIAGLVMLTVLPGVAEALTVYTYDLRTGDVEVEEYEPIAIEKTAAAVSDAVVSIDGYRDVPVYVIEHREGDQSRRQIGTVARKVSAGSGFFITQDGYILTNRHVVDDEDTTFVVNTGDVEMYAKVIYKDDEFDLAVIKVQGTDYPVIAIGKSAAVVGDEVVSVGNALGRFVDSVSAGKVISLGETVVARDGGSIKELHDLTATDARLYPGDSGGPLLDDEGRAVGVNVAIIAGTDVSFSIPVDAMRKVIRKAGLAE